MARLVTGGMGWVGSEIVRQLVNRGEEVVAFDIADNRNRVEDVINKIKFIRGDLGDISEVLNLFKDNQIDAIYHTGSMLNAACTANPWAAFRTNVIGCQNIFEAARIFNVPKMMFTSSRGSFGLGVKEVLDDWTIQRPTTFYGVAKVYTEGMGRFYSDRFGLDFRSIRYATIVVPGDRIHDAPMMIQDAIMGLPHSCARAERSQFGPFIYITDAAKAAIDVLDAPKDKIKTINYNVTGTIGHITVKEVATYLQQKYHNFQVSYKAVSELGNTTRIWDDTYARNEWGWKPDLATTEAIVEQFEKDVKTHPERYNIKL